MCDNKTLWNELIEFNSSFNEIELHINSRSIIISVKFDSDKDQINFCDKIFVKYNHIINSVRSNELSFVFYCHIFYAGEIQDTIKIFESLNFPSNVNMMKIMCGLEIDNDAIKLNNLPENLSQLKIISASSFDLSNLPTQIFLLDISESNCKFNLDYLPSSLKVLYLPFMFLTNGNNYQNNHSFKFEDFLNLPSSLTEINIGSNGKIVYNTTKEFVEKIHIMFK